MLAVRFIGQVNFYHAPIDFVIWLQKVFKSKEATIWVLNFRILWAAYANPMGIDYVDSDVVVEGDLVSARTVGQHVQFAQRIIALINCDTMLTALNKKIDMLEARINQLEQTDRVAERHTDKKISEGHNMAKVLIIATNVRRHDKKSVILEDAKFAVPTLK